MGLLTSSAWASGYFLNVLEGVTVAALVGLFAIIFRYTKRFLDGQQAQTESIERLNATVQNHGKKLRRLSIRLRRVERATEEV